MKSPGRERVVSRRAVGGNGGERKRIFEFSVVEATGCGGRVLARVDELQEPLAAVGVDRRVGAEIDAFRECAVRCKEHELSHEKWKNARKRLNYLIMGASISERMPWIGGLRLGTITSGKHLIADDAP